MLGVWRALAPIWVVVGLLSVAAVMAAGRTVTAWHERDLRMRAELAVGSARSSLVERWAPAQADALRALLVEIARDERVLAAVACGQGVAVANPGGPAEIDCAWLEPLGRQPGTATQEFDVAHGRVHVTSVPLALPDGAEVRMALVHDLSYVQAREQRAGLFQLATVVALGILASLLTIFAVRFARRGWNEELESFLRGGGPDRPGLAPALKEVRELVARLREEHDLEAQGGLWSPARLKRTLDRLLRRQRVIILANREPYIHERGEDGIRVLHPASGLVTALEPVMRACGGTWIAHGSGSADRDTVDDASRLKVPPGEGSYVLRRVWLTEAEERGYYYGFANEGLWPLCHIAHARPSFRAEDYAAYETVNRRFADAVCEEAEVDDPVVLIQDYHFALAPKFIRQRLPRATIIVFWHIPWPNAERFGICPYREALLEGLLGASIVGFHTQLHCNNFLESVDRFLEARLDREQQGVAQGGRLTLVRAWPISIEWPARWAEALPPPARCREQVLQALGLPANVVLGVGVDRLDYTKGVEERLAGVERALELYPELRGRLVFVQLAAPSRTLIAAYRELNERVERMAARVNERFGAPGYQPIVLRRAHHEPPQVFEHYRAADFCYVSSLHDGMNLVAKEFAASRDDERGVLVLSQFTGAAREMTDALVVNPYDLDQVAAAIHRAAHMPPAEQQERMRAMRALVSEFNVYRWAGRMLTDAARIRGHEQVEARRRAAPSPGPAVG